MLTTMAVQDWCPWCGTHMTGWGWPMMGLWLIVLIVIAVVVWQVLRDRRTSDGAAPREDLAEQALRERFARGEIDEDEYRRKLDELRR